MKTLADLHRMNEKAILNRPDDNIPCNTKIIIYGENDELGIRVPHMHINIDDGKIEFEVKLEHIRNMLIRRTWGNHAHSWDGYEDVKNRILSWLDEKPERYKGLSNLDMIIITWNTNNPSFEIDDEFVK